MNNKKILLLSLFSNIILFCILLIIILKGQDKINYIQIGPNNVLSILSYKINTIQKYIMLQIYLFIFEFLITFIKFNSDKIIDNYINDEIIKDYTINEFQINIQLINLFNSILKTIHIFITLSQIDIAICRILYKEIANIFLIRNILIHKKFLINQEKYYRFF
jgi:hypothetical protein